MNAARKSSLVCRCSSALRWFNSPTTRDSAREQRKLFRVAAGMSYYPAAGTAASAAPGPTAMPSAAALSSSPSPSSDLDLVAALSAPSTQPALKANGQSDLSYQLEAELTGSPRAQLQRRLSTRFHGSSSVQRRPRSRKWHWPGSPAHILSSSDTREYPPGRRHLSLGCD